MQLTKVSRMTISVFRKNPLSFAWFLGHAAKSLREIFSIPWHLIVSKTILTKDDRLQRSYDHYSHEMQRWCEYNAEKTVSVSRFICNDIIREFNICDVKTKTFRIESCLPVRSRLCLITARRY